MTNLKHCTVPALILLFLGGHLQRAWGDEAKKKGFYEQSIHGVVLVKGSLGQGSGWLVDRARKLVVTNHHVVGKDTTVTVIFPIFQDGKVVAEKTRYAQERGFSARVLDTDLPSDLAIVQLEQLPEGTVELKLAGSDADPGDAISSIGNPAASDAYWVASSGRVRVVYRKLFHHLIPALKARVERHCEIIETQVPVNHGDSGGPLLNDRAEVVGVVSSSLDYDRNKQMVHLMTWGIARSEVKRFVEQTTRLLEPKTAADFNLRGERRMKRESYTDAISDFTNALRLDKTSARACGNRAWCFAQKNDYDTALADCNEALRLDPQDGEAYKNRGWVYEVGKHDYDKAIADFTKAIEFDPQSAAAYNFRGVCHSRKKEMAAAFKDYHRAIEADPTFAFAYQNRGMKYRDLYHDYGKALADAEKAVELNPFLTEAWKVWADCLEARKEHDKAVNVFSYALRIDPSNPHLHYYRGGAFFAAKQWYKAEEDYTNVLRIDKTHIAAHYMRGYALEKNGKAYAAQADYNEALRVSPKLYADKLKKFNTAYLAIANQLSEPIRVYVQYEYLGTDGSWTWWPGQPGGAKYKQWEIPAGQVKYLLDEDWKVRGRTVRVWAKTVTSGESLTVFKDKDLVICPREGYRAHETTTFTYTIFRKKN